jgi:hypothetical protein
MCRERCGESVRQLKGQYPALIAGFFPLPVLFGLTGPAIFSRAHLLTNLNRIAES